MTPRIHALPETQAIPAPAAGPRAWPRGWRAAAGLTSVAAGAVILAGAFLPWVEAFAGLVQVPGVRGINGQILAAAGALIAVTGLYQLVRGGQAARWITGLTGFAAAGFSGYLLIQLAKTMRVLGSDSMVIARSGPGLWVAAAGSAAAFATLFFPPSSQATLRRDTGRPVLAWVTDRDSAGLRRGLQVALGIVWLADAALQYQPYMFTKASTASMLMPAAMGEPAFVSGPVLATMRLMTAHVAVWNGMFATIQLALAVGLLWRPTARVALAGTIAWSLSVWWLGEGLGGVFSGMANPLTGAPGAALLYALLAILIWPAVQPVRTAVKRAASATACQPAGRWQPAGPRGQGGLVHPVGHHGRADAGGPRPVGVADRARRHPGDRRDHRVRGGVRPDGGRRVPARHGAARPAASRDRGAGHLGDERGLRHGVLWFRHRREYRPAARPDRPGLLAGRIPG